MLQISLGKLSRLKHLNSMVLIQRKSIMYSDIKTGVIGVGSMGQNHARVYKEISNPK